MSFQIPADLSDFSGLGFEGVIPIEFNDVDMDRMLSHLLEMLIRKSRIVGSRTDQQAYTEYLDSLSHNPSILGLDVDSRREFLDGWVRSSLVRMGTKGLRRNAPQMDHLRPVTAAVYRSGLPRSRSRHRKADILFYSMIREEGKRRYGPTAVEDALRTITIKALGTGIDFGLNPEDAPAFDGSTSIDVTSRLALLFMDGIPRPVGIKNRDALPAVTLPGAMYPMGADALDLLDLYGTALPSSELSAHLMSLYSVRLFQLPLRFARSFRTLLETGQLADDVVEGIVPNPCEIYCDFTRLRGAESESIAKACVQRDLEVMRRFFEDRLFLRVLLKLDDRLADWEDDLRPLRDRPMEKLQFLVNRKSTPELQRALKSKLISLRIRFEEIPELEDGVRLIDELESASATTEEKLRQILVEGLRKRGLENQVKWFWSTGGVTKPYGLIRGTLKARSTWRYQPTDPLLLAMLLACFADETGQRTSSQLPATELIHRLESRFGVLVDRPPLDLDSPVARAAATQNRAAFLRQLQLLGCFDGLSDDFSAQIVRRPREAAR